jgi:hypothetical protein
VACLAFLTPCDLYLISSKTVAQRVESGWCCSLFSVCSVSFGKTDGLVLIALGVVGIAQP